MTMIGSLLYGTVWQSTFLAATSSIASLTASVVRDFFINAFLNPEMHVTVVMIFVGIVIAGCVGLAFLIKKIYEKYCSQS